MIFRNLLHKHDCPCCQKSLRLRLLPQVPATEAPIAFSCVHCKATLTYNDPDGPLLQFLATRKFAGIPLERFAFTLPFVFAVLFLEKEAARIVMLTLIAGPLIYYVLSPHRAYKVLGNCPPSES